MTTVMLTSFDKESPSERICKNVSRALLKEMKRLPDTWPAKDRAKDCKTAIACIRHLACGIDSPASQRHTIHGKARYIRLSQEQSDLLQHWYLEALWDEPAAL